MFFNVLLSSAIMKCFNPFYGYSFLVQSKRYNLNFKNDWTDITEFIFSQETQSDGKVANSSLMSESGLHSTIPYVFWFLFCQISFAGFFVLFCS